MRWSEPSPDTHKLQTWYVDEDQGERGRYCDAYLVILVEDRGAWSAVVEEDGKSGPVAARGPFSTRAEAHAWGVERAERLAQGPTAWDWLSESAV